jgi:hypothetical protein
MEPEYDESKAGWRRRKVLEVVINGGEDGVTARDITDATKIGGAYLSHALWGLIRRSMIRVEWQRVEKGARFAIIRTGKTRVMWNRPEEETGNPFEQFEVGGEDGRPARLAPKTKAARVYTLKDIPLKDRWGGTYGQKQREEMLELVKKDPENMKNWTGPL